MIIINPPEADQVLRTTRTKDTTTTTAAVATDPPIETAMC
jgi:hypothetical protein